MSSRRSPQEPNQLQPIEFFAPSTRYQQTNRANFCEKCQRFTTRVATPADDAKLCRINSSIYAPLSLQIKFDESDSIGRIERQLLQLLPPCRPIICTVLSFAPLACVSLYIHWAGGSRQQQTWQDKADESWIKRVNFSSRRKTMIESHDGQNPIWRKREENTLTLSHTQTNSVGIGAAPTI